MAVALREAASGERSRSATLFHDYIHRRVGKKLSEKLGQQVEVAMSNSRKPDLTWG